MCVWLTGLYLTWGQRGKWALNVCQPVCLHARAAHTHTHTHTHTECHMIHLTEGAAQPYAVKTAHSWIIWEPAHTVRHHYAISDNDVSRFLKLDLIGCCWQCEARRLQLWMERVWILLWHIIAAQYYSSSEHTQTRSWEHGCTCHRGLASFFPPRFI